jgi:hypothetical protein
MDNNTVRTNRPRDPETSKLALELTLNRLIWEMMAGLCGYIGNLRQYALYLEKSKSKLDGSFIISSINIPYMLYCVFKLYESEFKTVEYNASQWDTIVRKDRSNVTHKTKVSFLCSRKKFWEELLEVFQRITQMVLPEMEVVMIITPTKVPRYCLVFKKKGTVTMCDAEQKFQTFAANLVEKKEHERMMLPFIDDDNKEIVDEETKAIDEPEKPITTNDTK